MKQTKTARGTKPASKKAKVAPKAKPTDKWFVLSRLTKFGLICLLVAALGLLPAFYYRYISNSASTPGRPTIVAPINEELAKTTEPTIVSGDPTHLDILSLQMSLTVTEGVFNEKTGQWTLSLNKAHYANLSAKPNNKAGNTLIYGHYRPEVFARLHLIKIGSEAQVTTNNGYKFIYKLQSVHETSPSDTSLFSYTGSPQLILQTCSGAWFQHRQLFTFQFVRYEKI